MICTFFGHRDAELSLQDLLYATIQELVEKGVDRFYVGNQGNFDRMARVALQKISHKYPFIRYSVVLAYLSDGDMLKEYPTVFPEGLETALPRFAIDKRNRWMIQKADIVVAYCRNRGGSSEKYVQLALKKRKTVINLGSEQ